MTDHRMIGMAEQCFAIFGGNADCTQTTPERVAQVAGIMLYVGAIGTATAAAVHSILYDTGVRR